MEEFGGGFNLDYGDYGSEQEYSEIPTPYLNQEEEEEELYSANYVAD